MWKAGEQPCFTEEPWNTPLAEPVLQQLLGAVYRAEHTWKPLWFWKNTAWKAVHWLEMFVAVCVPSSPRGGRHKANVQGVPCRGAHWEEQGMTTKFTSRFYLLCLKCCFLVCDTRQRSSWSCHFSKVISPVFHAMWFPQQLSLPGVCEAPGSHTASSPLIFMKGKLLFSGNKQKSVPGSKF